MKEMKKCKTCGEEKELSEFGKAKKIKDGYLKECKKCMSIKRIAYKEKNVDDIKEYLKEYYEKNKEKISEYQKEYKEKNKEHLKEYSREYNKEWRVSNKDKIKEKRKEWRVSNKDKNSEYSKEYYELNKERRKDYYELNKEKITEYQKEYKEKNKEKRNLKRKEKKKIDPLFNLTCSIRSSISGSLKKQGYKKNSKTEEILQIPFKDFKKYIEDQFEPWMTWENYGLYNGELNYGWDLDHIIPVSSATTEEEILELNKYINFQPLCSKVNRNIKINKLNFGKLQRR
jgi:hypothetical protein